MPGLQQAESHLGKNRPFLHSLLLLITGLRRLCLVAGDSMLPSLHEGDVVIYKPINTEKVFVQEGEIVVAKHPLEPHNLIIKRVQGNSPYGLDLRGDNCSSSIDSRQFGIVSNQFLIGIVEDVISKY